MPNRHVINIFNLSNCAKYAERNNVFHNLSEPWNTPATVHCAYSWTMECPLRIEPWYALCLLNCWNVFAHWTMVCLCRVMICPCLLNHGMLHASVELQYAMPMETWHCLCWTMVYPLPYGTMVCPLPIEPCCPCSTMVSPAPFESWYSSCPFWIMVFPCPCWIMVFPCPSWIMVFPCPCWIMVFPLPMLSHFIPLSIEPWYATLPIEEPWYAHTPVEPWYATCPSRALPLLNHDMPPVPVEPLLPHPC